MALKLAVKAELNHLGVDKHKFQLGRMLLVKQRCYYGVEAHRFSLSGGTGHKYVGHLGEVGYEYILGDCGAHCHRQLIVALLELTR